MGKGVIAPAVIVGSATKGLMAPSRGELISLPFCFRLIILVRSLSL